MNVTPENVQALIGKKVTFNEGVFKRPRRREMVHGVVIDVMFQEGNVIYYYDGSSSHFGSHFRANVQVGNVNRNIAVKYLKPA